RNTVRAPKRSAVQPLAGMNTASESRYDVTASLSASGLAPMSAAIAGSDVAMIVESMFSMNSATAMMRGTRRSRLMRGPGRRRFSSPDHRKGTLRAAHACLDISRVPPRPRRSREEAMIYILAFLLPPLGLLFNGQPFSAVFNVLLIVFGLIFGWFFPV